MILLNTLTNILVNHLSGNLKDIKIDFLLVNYFYPTLNQRFATEFTPADQLFFDQIEATALEDKAIAQAAVVNTKDNFAPVLERHLEDLFLQRMVCF